MADHITLVSDDIFGAGTFRTASEEGFENSIYYDSRHYANNSEGMDSWKTPNEYAGSTLQLKIEEIADTLPENEQALIVPWSFNGSYSYETPGLEGITNQILWALSKLEFDHVSIIGFDFQRD